MSELGDLLELLQRAGRGFETVFAEYRVLMHHARSAEAFQAAADDAVSGAAARGGGAARVGAAAQAVSAGRGAPGESERIVRLWMEGDDRAREEQQTETGLSYSISNGDR